MKSFIDQSRVSWHNKERQERASMEDIQTGALQRIADATEKMAANYSALQNERDYFKRRCENLESENKTLKRQVSAYRGVVKKKKAEKQPFREIDTVTVDNSEPHY